MANRIVLNTISYHGKGGKHGKGENNAKNSSKNFLQFIFHTIYFLVIQLESSGASSVSFFFFAFCKRTVAPTPMPAPASAVRA